MIDMNYVESDQKKSILAEYTARAKVNVVNIPEDWCTMHTC